jgi:hypothetical protein
MDQDTEKKEIGSISKDLLLRFQKMIKEKDKLTNEMEVQMDVYKSEMELKMLKEFGDRVDYFTNLKDELWLEITNELDVPEERDYSLNNKTGIVSEKIKKGDDDDPTSEFIKKLKLAKRMS